MSNITIHIEEVIIHSEAHFDRVQLGAVIEQALAQMIGERGLPAEWQQSGTIPAVDGGEMRPPASAEALGQQIARAVYGGFSR